MTDSKDRVTLLTAGTRGDTQPFVALGVELEKLGYRVSLAAPGDMRSLVERNGLTHTMVRGDVKEIMRSGELDDAIHADTPISALRSLANKEFMTQLVDMTEDMINACEDASAIVYHPGAAIGHFIVRQRGIPSFLGSPFPLLPASEHPALLFYDKPIPKCLYKASHRMFA